MSDGVKSAHRPAHAGRKTARADESTIAALAKETHTSHEVVKHIYDEEMAALHANASVKNFIDVIARRRVKQRLLARKAQAN